MMRKNLLRLLWVVLGVVVLGAGPADSLEPLVDLESGRSLVSNMKAHKVGDIITILITETATANATSKTNSNEKSEMSGGPGLGFLDVLDAWGLDTESKYTGDGRTQRTGNLSANITVRIAEEMHNGDFRLLGNRMVDINGERQLIEISGICRPRDIRSDNTIDSTYIADARISYNGSGPVNSSSEPGIVTKLFNWLF
jgi:flagellar L-ring protein precursor FlgH